jgi:hypothetical protein
MRDEGKTSSNSNEIEVIANICIRAFLIVLAYVNISTFFLLLVDSDAV